MQRRKYGFAGEYHRICERCPRLKVLFAKQAAGALPEKKIQLVLRALIEKGRYGLAKKFLRRTMNKKVRLKLAKYLEQSVHGELADEGPVLCTDFGCGENEIRRCFAKEILAGYFPEIPSDQLFYTFRPRKDKKGNFTNSPCELLALNSHELVDIGLPVKRDKTLDMRYIDKGKFNANLYLRYIQDALQAVTQGPSSVLHIYRGGYWHNQETITSKFDELLGNHVDRVAPDMYVKQIADNCIDMMKLNCPDASTLESGEEYINVGNRLVYFDEATGKLKTRHHTSKVFTTNQIPVDLVKGAKCPNFIKFLESIFAGDKERIRLLQEYMGYCLCNSTKAEKMIIFLGRGANGKSVLCRVIRELVGGNHGASCCAAEKDERLCDGRSS